MRERSGEAIDWLNQRRTDLAAAPGSADGDRDDVPGDGDAREAIAAFDRALAWHPSNPELLSNRLFTTNFLSTFDPQASLAAHRDYERRIRIPKPATATAGARGVTERNGSGPAGHGHANHGHGHASHGRAHARTSRATDGSRLRIGYVSGDLRHHAVARFLMPVLRHHDRERFHVTAYYTGRIVDAVTREIAGALRRVPPGRGDGRRRAVSTIADDGIDVLVDCSGHSAGNRLPVFAARAAPSQVSWMGYLGSTGLSTMDVRLTDVHADPVGVSEAFHVEPLIRLPDTMWAYEPYPDAKDPQPPMHRSDGAVVFGALSNPAKLSDATLDAWAQILSATPASRLKMTARDDAAMRERILRSFAARSVEPSRVELLSRMSTQEYLDAYSSIDIGLDTFPVSGGTTVCDALWQGVPVLAVRSARPFGSTSSSVLHQVGHGRLGVRFGVVAGRQSRDPGERDCSGTSGDRRRREGELRERPDAQSKSSASTSSDVAQRESLRERMRSSPLLDASRVARAVERILLGARAPGEDAGCDPYRAVVTSIAELAEGVETFCCLT